MDLGFAVPVCGAWATPENQVAVAERAERLGYRTLWTFQRLLYAVDPAEPYGPARAPQWPAYFRSVHDPLITLAYLAGRTSTIRLGVAVLNAPFFNPLLLA